MNAKDFARFWAQVAVSRDSAECWPWIGDRVSDRGDYGRFCADGKSYRAHIVAFEMVNGPQPEGSIVRHACDNPPCCNPAHLIDGTHADNTRDMFERGRNPDRRGEKHPLAQIEENQVREIRRLAAMGRTHHWIAEQFAISRQHVGKIVRRENWKHV